MTLQTFAALAQEATPAPDPRLSLQTDDNAYPDVKLTIALLGVDPAFQLQPDNYQITGTDLGETQGEPRSLPIVTDDDQPIALVLALDCSVVNVEDWTTVKEAALAVVAQLTPQDAVAVIAYGAQADVVQKWVSGSQVADVRAAIERIVPSYTRTAFNAALWQARKVADERTGRRALLMLADRADNTIQPDLIDPRLADLLQQKRVPLYIYAYGEKAQRSRTAFNTYTDASSGFVKIVDQPNQLVDELRPLLTAFHRSFTVTPRFRVPLDDNPHHYELQVNYNNVLITATDEFRTKERPLQPVLHGLHDGMPAYGMLAISTTVEPQTADVVSITYYLDHQPLYSPAVYREHRLQWNLDHDLTVNKNLKPDTYTLSVRVQDLVGNSGETTATLQVAQPLTATIYVSKTAPMYIGEYIPLQIAASGEFTIEQILLFVDDKPSATIDQYNGQGETIPMPWSLSTTRLISGLHQLQMYVTDVAGRTLPEPVQITFSVQTPPPPTWWERLARTVADLWDRSRWLLALATIGSLVGLFLLWALLAFLRRRYRQAQLATYWLKVVNQGNTPGDYQFRAVEVNNHPLDFAFVWDPMRPVPLPQPGRTALPSATNGATKIALPAGTTTGAPTVDGAPNTATPTLALPTLTGQRGQAAQLLGGTKRLIDFLNLIAQLPGPLGEPARQLAVRLRGGVQTIEQAERSVERVAANVRKVGESASSLGVRLPSSSPVPPPAAAPPVAAPTAVATVATKPIPPVFVAQTSPSGATNGRWELHQSAPEQSSTQLEIAAGQGGWWGYLLHLPPGEAKMVAVQISLRPGRWRRRRYQFELYVRNVQEKSAPSPLTETVRLGGFRLPMRIIK